MQFWFTGDEHLGHANVIKYENRPFASVEEMDSEIIRRHNLVVRKEDVVVHVGDFTMRNKEYAQNAIRQLHGTHIFLMGNHDYWLKNSAKHIWEKKIQGHYVVACHYAMRVWNRSHYGSFQVHGHSHGNLAPIGRQMDVGVDCWDFYPVPFSAVLETLKDKEIYGEVRDV